MTIVVISVLRKIAVIANCVELPAHRKKVNYLPKPVQSLNVGLKVVEDAVGRMHALIVKTIQKKGNKTVGTRNRLSKKDDLPTTITKLSGQRDAKDRWEYYRQARQANFCLGLLFFQSKLEEVMNEPEQTN